MQPSFQYQPVNIQRAFNKPPNFLNNKILDKSAPTINNNKPYTFIQNPQNQQSSTNLNQNKSSYISTNKEITTNNLSPKPFLQKNNNLNSYSNPALKFYHSPQGLKNQQQKIQRLNRGEMSRSLVIEQSELMQGQDLMMQNKSVDEPIKFSPPRRAPRMSQGYQPMQNNYRQNTTATTSTYLNEDSPSIQKQKQTSFMKIKKFEENSHEKRINVPAFLHKNTNEMRRSSFEISKISNLQKTPTSTNLFNNHKRKIMANDFEKIKQLGNGKYGRVYLVKQKYTGFVCALKVILKKLLVEEEITEQFIRELKIQMYLNHPNIIKMYGYFDDEKNIYIILEVGTGGQLYHHLKKNQSLPEAKVAFLMKQICQAVNEIHSLRIIHRDIKPQNIVLHDNIIKLCDFGWSVHQDNKLRTTFCGTPLYVCPEILRGKQYDQKIDIWSLGIMMYQMVVGQNPFKITKQEQLIKIVKDEIKIPSYAYVSTEARDFLDKCLQKNPQDRVTIRELMNHVFLKKYQQKDKKTFNL